MVKFQKQLAQQLVAEWKEGYCDYKKLKRDVKRIKEHHQLMHVKMSVEKISRSSVHPLRSFGMPLVALSDRLVNSPLFLRDKVENITVHIRQLRFTVSEEGFTETELYETELLDSALTPTEFASNFFKRLDAELNRVNKFYKLKEVESHLRAHSLQLQVATLLELRERYAVANTGDCKRTINSSCILTSTDKCKPEKFLDVRKLQAGLESQIAVRKEQVQFAEKLLRAAFADFYRGLDFLKTYSEINIMAFSKILKKYDKVTGWNASVTYLKVVEASYFASSDKVVKLMDEVENIFTLHLTKKSHRQAMIYLRPVQQNSFSCNSYFQGVFTGCSVAFLSVLALAVFAPGPSQWDSGHGFAMGGVNQKAFLSLSSTVGLVLLHLYMYAWNVYLWRRARINYALIFKWAPGTDLQFQEVLILSTGLTTLWMLGMIVVKLYPALPHVDLIPAVILVLLLAVLVLPLNTFYRSTRIVFLRGMIHVVSSPFHEVALADFFLADQLTSQVTVLKNIQFLTCYYLGGYYRSQNENACLEGSIVRSLQYVAVLPYWWRLMQCARRWMDDRDIRQALNGGKYLSALFSSAMKVAYRQHSGFWLVPYAATSLMSSVYGIYWDIVRDWGLLQFKSANPWLRDKLLLKYKLVYYISIVANVVLKLSWLAALVLEQKVDLNSNNVDAVLAVLEVLRRGLWNFYSFYSTESRAQLSSRPVHRLTPSREDEVPKHPRERAAGIEP